jgi:CDP-diacylglycerol--glycerol-3-phosphate 3-phosphatidyltransferase
VAGLARHGVTANQVTVAALVLCLAYGSLMAALPGSSWLLVLLLPVLAVRTALNAMDGMLARDYGQESKLGAALNELGDVAGDAALYLPLALVPGFPSGMIVLLVALAAISEMAGLMAQVLGRRRSYRGPMGKSDRVLVLGIVALVTGLGLAPGLWLDLVVAAVMVLLLATIANRVRDGVEVSA